MSIADPSTGPGTPSSFVPAMSAEGESELLLEPRPIRFSGFLALFLGLLSVFAVFAQAMLIFAALAIVVGIYALRPYANARPIGYFAALSGLVCAVLFAAWGITERQLRYQFMAQRSVAFAGDWLKLMAEGNLELACELQYPPRGRQPASMPLAQYYRESGEGQRGMQSFKENTTVLELIEGGRSVQWRLNRPPTYTTTNGRHLASTIWQDDSGSVKSLVKIGMEFLPSDDDKLAQWTVYEISTWIDP